MIQETISSQKRYPVLKGRLGVGVREAFSFFYPGYTTESDIFSECITRYLHKNSVVLDAGCGKGIFFRYPWRSQVQLLVGCDVEGSVSCNPNISSGICADLMQLPFVQDSFNIVFSHYVLEHLEDHHVVFSEFCRILKHGGKLIVLTPSKYHYVSTLSRMTPHWFHEAVSKVRGNVEHDAFPTKYVANCKGELVRHAEKSGLVLREFITKEASPNYLLWSLPSFLLGVAYERFVNSLAFMSPFRSSIIAIFEKSPSL
jgi:ubiquinone/menaquinone biosynthesis C-methylase UbiE